MIVQEHKKRILLEHRKAMKPQGFNPYVQQLLQGEACVSGADGW